MAKLSGYGGGFQFAGTTPVISDANQNIYSWSAEIACDALEVTGFANAGQRTYIRGLRGWTATAEAYLDGTNVVHPSDVGEVGDIKLHVDTGDKYYHGDAILTGVSPSVAVDGVATQSLSFQGLSDLSYSDLA